MTNKRKNPNKRYKKVRLRPVKYNQKERKWEYEQDRVLKENVIMMPEQARRFNKTGAFHVTGGIEQYLVRLVEDFDNPLPEFID